MSKDFLAFNTDGDILSLDGKLVRKHGVVVDSSMKAAIRATLGVPGAAEGLVPANNLSDVSSISTSRTNLEVFSEGEINDRSNARQPSNGVYFNGSNSYLTGSGSFSALIGTSDFAVSWIMSYPTAANDDETIFEDGNVSLRIAGGASDYFRLRIDGTDYIIPTAITAHDEDKHYVVDVDRSGNATLRIEGKDSGTVDVSAEVATVLTGSAYSINKTGTNGINATFKSLVAWNKLLGASYCQRLAANGNTPDVAYQFGKAPYASDFSAGVDSWTGGNNTLTGNIDSIASENDWLRGVSSAGVAYFRRTFSNAVAAGQWVRVKGKLVIPSGNTTCDQILIRDDSAGNIKEGGLNITPGSSDTVFEFDETFQSQTAWTALRLYLGDGGSTTITTGDTAYIKELEVGPVGSLVVLLQENIQADGSIRDASSNGLHAAGTNTSALKKLQVLEIDAQSPAADSKLLDIKVAGATKASIDEDGDAVVNQLKISNIPTSSGGLSSGDIWSDSGTLKIVS